MIRFVLSAPTPSLNAGGGRNWKARWVRQKRLQRAMAQEIAAQRVAAGAGWMKPIERAHIRVVRHGVRLLDEDNLKGGVKPLIDVLKHLHPKNNPLGLGLIAGDEPERLRLDVEQVKCPRAQQKTVVEITQQEEAA